MVFKNRVEAGRLLGEQLSKYRNQDVLILGIPRGGVVVASEVARALEAELDIIITKKISSPANPEYALGAVDARGHLVLNEGAVKDLSALESYIEKEKIKVMEKIRDSEKKFRGEKEPPKIKDRIVIIIDDGAATGSTVLPAVDSIKEEKPEKVIIALPVCPPDTASRLKAEVDELVVLATPLYFMAVAQFYENFDQVSDTEVKRIMDTEFMGRG